MGKHIYASAGEEGLYYTAASNTAMILGLDLEGMETKASLGNTWVSIPQGQGGWVPTTSLVQSC